MVHDRKGYYIWHVPNDRIVDVVILKRKKYKDVWQVLEVVAFIALMIWMASFAEPRFDF